MAKRGKFDLYTICKNNGLSHLIEEWDYQNNENTPHDYAQHREHSETSQSFHISANIIVLRFCDRNGDFQALQILVDKRRKHYFQWIKKVALKSLCAFS